MKQSLKNIQSIQQNQGKAETESNADQKIQNNDIITKTNTDGSQMDKEKYQIIQNQGQQIINSQSSTLLTSKKHNTQSIGLPLQNQIQNIEEYKTNNFKSLLITSRDSISKRKISMLQPVAASTSQNRKSTGYLTERQRTSSRSRVNQQNSIEAIQLSNNGRSFQQQPVVKTPLIFKNGINPTSNDQIKSKQIRNKITTPIGGDTKYGQRSFNQNSGFALDDYLLIKEDSILSNYKVNPGSLQISPILKPLQPQTNKNKTMQNFYNQSINNQSSPSTIQQLLNQEHLNTGGNALFTTQGSQMQNSSMYQSTLIQQQINDLCSHFYSSGKNDDINSLKNFLINLIQKQEEQLKVLASRCDGVRELAEMIYADIPLPSQNISYVNNPNSMMGSPMNSFDPQFPSPINTINETPENQYQKIQNNSNFNTLNGQPVNDLAKIRDALHSLSQSLVSASQNEITLGTKLREVEKLNLDISMLKKQNQNYKEKTTNQQNVIEILQTRVKNFQEDNNKLLIHLNVEKKSAQSSSKKVASLEKRVEFILENDINVNLNPNDKLRSTLNELLRENESLKRDLAHKNQDIDRLSGQVQKLNQHIQRLNKKMESIKKNPQGQSNSSTGQPSNSSTANNENKNNSAIFQKDDIELLKNFKIPSNLNFRIVSLKSEQSNIITDIIELGANAFSKHVLAQIGNDQKRSLINLVAQQFISYKDLSERINQLVNSLSEMSRMDSMKNIAVHINSTMPFIFNSKRCNLWIVDKLCGIFQTFTGNGGGVVVTSKCLLNKGLISDSFILKTPINSKTAQNKPLLCRIDGNNSQKEECDYVSQTLLIPIFCNNDKQQVKAILEVSDSFAELFSFDEEYYAIILSQFLTQIFSNIITQQIYEIDVKYNNMLFQAYEQLIQSKTKFYFTQRVRILVKQLFSIDNSIFYFVEKDKLISYNDPENIREEFDLGHGLAGVAVSDKKSYIIHDIKSNSYFNPLVDISSLLPIYAIPFINKNADDEEQSVMGLLEIALKSKLQTRMEKDVIIDTNAGYFGLEEPLSHIVEKFSQLVMNALQNITLTE